MALKEQAIQDRSAERFEAALQQLAEGLPKKGATKRYDKVVERLGRLKEKYARVAQHYDITVTADEHSDNASALIWTRREKPHSQATHPGVSCLRTNLGDWDEATLWQTYTMLTDLEAVFRSLKSELGLLPIYHQKEKRVNGHIFITLIAYHLVHTLRTQLKAQDIHDSWETLRGKMENQQRITVIFRREDGKTSICAKRPVQSRIRKPSMMRWASIRSRVRLKERSFNLTHSLSDKKINL